MGRLAQTLDLRHTNLSPMPKPTTFFSHSSHDKAALLKLKGLFLAKTGGSIDVFMSSDGQSISFGKNWVHSVEQALEQTKLMLVFVTPSSLRSSWLHFESGFAYSKGIQVVPIGLGIDLSTVGAPLSLLQGFNATSEAGFNNIIAVANQVFAHSHAETFTPDDFRLITASGELGANNTILGPHAPAIKEITVRIPDSKLGGLTPSRALSLMVAVLIEANVEHTAGEKSVRTQGMTLRAQEGNGPDELRFELDPAVADLAFPLIDLLARVVHPQGMADISVRFDFVEGVDAVERHHSLTGRLYGTGVRLYGDRELEFKSLSFSVAHLLNIGMKQPTRASAYLKVATQLETISLTEVRELMDLLFDRDVLVFTTN